MDIAALPSPVRTALLAISGSCVNLSCYIWPALNAFRRADGCDHAAPMRPEAGPADYYSTVLKLLAQIS